MSGKSGWRCSLAQWGLLWLRIALGVIFMAHGAQKVFGLWGGHGLSGTVNFFQQNLGVPPILGYVACFTELLGGAAILLGLLTRLSALGLAAVMGVAIYKVHWVNGFFINWYNTPNVGHGIEYNVALMAMSLCLLFTGAGCISLDSILFCRKCEEDSPEVMKQA